MPPPLADNQLVQMSLLPTSTPSSSSAPDSPSTLVVQQSSIMPDRSAFDDDTVHTHPLMTRARSKTQPEISFTPHRHHPPTSQYYHHTAATANDSYIHPTNPPVALLTPYQQSTPHHHNKSKSHHTPATLLRPLRANNTATHAAATHKLPSHPQQPQWGGGERVLEPREKKQRMLEYAQYAQSRRQQAAKRAKEKAERAILSAKGIRDSLQAHNGNHSSDKRKPIKPHTATRKQEAAGGLSIGTQTTTGSSTGSDMKDIEQRLVAMIRQARVRLQHETNDLEEEILADKENREGKGTAAPEGGTQQRTRQEGEGGAEDEESEEEKTARLTYLHSHLLVCEKLERQVLDCLDSTFALLEAYGADHDTTAADTATGGRTEGGVGGAGGKKRKKRVGKRMSKFERLLMEEKEKDLLRMRRLQQQQQPLDNCLPLPPAGDGSFDLYHSASSLSASTGTGSSASGTSSQSFTFHDRPSFHTLQVNDRQSQQQATAFLQSADEHQVVIPSPSPKLQSPRVAAVPQPPAFSLVTHDPSSSIVTFPSPTSAAAPTGTTPPHPRRLSWQEKQQLWTGHSPKQPHILNYATIQLDTNTLTATARRMMSPMLAHHHQHQPSILAAPFNYSMSATPRHHTQRSNVSTDLRVIPRQPSLLSPPSVSREEESKRTPNTKERLDDPSSIAQLLSSRLPPMSPSSIASPRSRSVTYSPPQPSAPPLEPVPESDSTTLFRAHLLPAFVRQQHDLLYTQIRLCYGELTACRAQLGGSLSAQQRIEQQWDEVCLTLAHRGTRVCKYHSAVDASGRRWGRERAERWLQLDSSGLSMQWSRRKAAGPYSSLLLSTITDIRVGDECEFVEKLKAKDTTTRRLIGKAAVGSSSSSSGGGRLDVDDVDVGCCVSFVGLKRRLDVVFEQHMEVDVWLWICRRAKAATGVD